MFWGYRASCKGGEYWVSKEKFALWKDREIKRKISTPRPAPTPESRALNLAAVRRYQELKKLRDSEAALDPQKRLPKVINKWRLEHG